MTVEFVRQTNGTFVQEETGVVASLTKKQLDILDSLVGEISELRGQIGYAGDSIDEIEITGTVGYGFDVTGGEDAKGEVSEAQSQADSIYRELNNLVVELGGKG